MPTFPPLHQDLTFLSPLSGERIWSAPPSPAAGAPLGLAYLHLGAL